MIIVVSIYHVTYGEKIKAKNLLKWKNWNWGFNELSINLFSHAQFDLLMFGHMRVRSRVLNDKV